MSRYRSYGKSTRGNSRAGLHFDKLLKACSNSKKPPTAMAAGALGRFGVASFTSTRSCLDSTGEDDLHNDNQEKPSRFSSLHKRPRLMKEPLQPPNLQVDPFIAAHYPVNSEDGSPNGTSGGPPVLQPITVLKPRKFFKSRGPMEVEASPIPFRPDVTNLIQANPILSSNQSNISNSWKSPGKPAASAGSFSSPPSIKLKIIKDKVTSKFKSVPETEDDKTPTKGHKHHHKKEKKLSVEKPPKVAGKGRGRPPKVRDPDSEPLNNNNNSKKPPKPAQLPTRSSARVTRSANVKYKEVEVEDEDEGGDGEDEVVGQNQNTAPLVVSTDISFEQAPQEQETYQEEQAHNTSKETLKKLEDDAEFQQLSQMLSSMEDEDSGSALAAQQNLTLSANPTFQSPQQPLMRTEEKRDNLRSILEDDWNESFEDSVVSDSPKKHLQSSPPKVSRFDPSAFMTDKEKADKKKKPKLPSYDSSNITSSSQEQLENPKQYNINSSPYSMKNLLGTETQSQDKIDCVMEDNSEKFSQDSESQRNSEFVDSQEESSQQKEMESQKSPTKLSQTQSQQQPSKKASIFKSRATKADKPTKKAVYKHTFGREGAEEPKTEESKAPGGSLFADFDESSNDCEDADLALRRKASGAEGSASSGEEGGKGVLCKKGSKKYFTVVRNVKAGHELQESGEFHEFDGDIWYILDDLKDKNPMNSRCLSALTLAGRCMDQAFRMHLRAHGTVAEFCKELHDSPQHPVLSLLAATVLFVLSQDRLNMDLDTESLKLILALTKADFQKEGKEYLESENSKNRQLIEGVVQLCTEMKSRGHAKHLNLEKLNASELALETLLYLTSKRAGEWVKHELRTLGGLDSIVEETDSSFKFVRSEIRSQIWNEGVKERLRKIDRCLEVLGQVTFNHEDNQRYLMQVSTRKLESSGEEVKCIQASPTAFLEIFQFCKEVIMKTNPEIVNNEEQTGAIREILFLVLRLLVNLSHDYRGIVLGSEIMMGIDGFLELALHSIFELTFYFPDEKVFDLLMHSLCLVLNLVETSIRNRQRLLESTIRKSPTGHFAIGNSSSFNSEDSGMEDEVPLLDALIQMFLQRERSAKTEEQHTDNILTTGEKESHSQKDSQDEETSVQNVIDTLIQTAGKHMENSLIAAYISLLIGFLIMDDVTYVEKLKEAMPGKNLLPLMIVLKKLFNFMSITSSASGSARGLKATAIALKFYAKVDSASAEELEKIIPG